MYQEIPKGTRQLFLNLWRCGDDCCCHAFQICAEIDPSAPDTPEYLRGRASWYKTLWGGAWFWPSDWPHGRGPRERELEEIKREVVEAGKHYGVAIDTSNGEDPLEHDYWDWCGRCLIEEGKPVHVEKLGRSGIFHQV